ncbi:MAG: hypothetical protein VYE64_03965 [Planctomycetota bacterium]|nr:hypothetical protein [Planctomycetota bacterium]
MNEKMETTAKTEPEVSARSLPKKGVSKEVFKYVLSALILGAGVAVALVLTSLRGELGSADIRNLNPKADVVAAQLYQGPLDLVVSGTVVPYREIEIAAQVGGQITTKYPECEAGQFVKKGAKLFEIDRSDYDLDVKTIKSEIQQAQRSLEEVEKEIEGAIKNIELAQSEFELQQKDFERTSRISGALSESELDQAKRVLLQAQTALTGRKNSLDLLRARELKMQASLDLAKSRLEKSELNLQRTTVLAPDDGVIVAEFVEQGNYATPGKVLVSLEVTRRAEVQSNLTPGELRWLRRYADRGKDFQNEADVLVYQLPKMAVEIYDSADPEVKWDGILERFNGIGRDELTKTIPCSIVVDRPIILKPDGAHVLVRGMYVKCRMEIPPSQLEGQTFFELPATAIQPYVNEDGASGDVIWVATDLGWKQEQADGDAVAPAEPGLESEIEGRLRKVDIDIVQRFKRKIDGREVEFVVVRDNGGLANGDWIIASPLPNPVDGVTVVEIVGQGRLAAAKELLKKKSGAGKSLSTTSTSSRSSGGGSQ